MIKQNRSLARGLTVLEVLARHRALSLAELCRETDLPKSTLRRLLATLIEQRFVRRSLADGLYRALVTLPDVSISPVSSGLALVADIGLGHALVLTEEIGWPSDIHVLELPWVRIVESTRAVSPFSLYRGQVDRRLNIFGSATGSVCLSQMPEDKVRHLFERDGIEERFRPMRFGLTWPRFKRHLSDVRHAGYGWRVPQYTGETVSNDNLAAIALPIRRQAEILGAISLLWPRRLMEPPDFAARYLPQLSATVGRIESDLEDIDGAAGLNG